jgi:hypothetical protein
LEEGEVQDLAASLPWGIGLPEQQRGRRKKNGSFFLGLNKLTMILSIYCIH